MANKKKKDRCIDCGTPFPFLLPGKGKRYGSLCFQCAYKSWPSYADRMEELRERVAWLQAQLKRREVKRKP